MFLDLNLPLDDEHTASGVARTLDFEHIDRRVLMAQELGYDGVAVSHTVVGKLTAKDQAYAGAAVGGPAGGANATLQVGPTQAGRPPRPPPHRFSRLNIVLDNASLNQQLNGANPIVSSYDLVSVQPGNDKIFQMACGSFDIDIVSIDLSGRLPFSIKFGAVHQAVQRGVFFEINYAPAIRSAATRRSLISNALNVVRVTKGRNLLISSGAVKALELRGPYDVANLRWTHGSATLFGLSQSEAKACLSTNARAVLYHAEMRRNTYRGAVAIQHVPTSLTARAPAPETAAGPAAKGKRAAPTTAGATTKRVRPEAPARADPDPHHGAVSDEDDEDDEDDADADDDQDGQDGAAMDASSRLQAFL